MARDIHPFDFSSLDSVSSAQEKLLAILEKNLPSIDKQDAVFTELAALLQGSLAGTCRFELTRSHFETSETWKDRLTGQGVFATISAVPTGAKGAIVMDPVLALALVDQVLGGKGEEVTQARPLTEIEKGVLSFILAKILRATYQTVSPAVAPLRLESIEDQESILKPLLSNARHLGLLELIIHLGEFCGMMQVVLPDTFLREIISAPVEQIDSEELEARSQSRLKTWGDLSYPMRARVGQSELKLSELAALKPGDIVLVDQTQCHFEGKKLAGDLRFESSVPRGPALDAQINNFGPPMQLTLKQIHYSV
jgi:flagellar motor switch protein FliM